MLHEQRTANCKSYRLDINKDAVNTEEMKELTDTKMGRFYSDMRATGPSTMKAKEGYILSSR